MDDVLAIKKKTKDASRPSPKESLADRTAITARDIVAAEARKRHDLTMSLRAARLAREEDVSVDPPPKPKSRR